MVGRGTAKKIFSSSCTQWRAFKFEIGLPASAGSVTLQWTGYYHFGNLGFSVLG